MSRKTDTSFTMRMTIQQKELIREAAHIARSKSMTDYMLHLALNEAHKLIAKDKGRK